MTNVSKKLARTAAVGIWFMASIALAGQAKTGTTGCFEGGAQGKAVPTAKTQDECQKLGEKFTWLDASAHADHKSHGTKTKGKVKQQAKSEAKTDTKPAEAATEAAPAAQSEAPAAPTGEASKK